MVSVGDMAPDFELMAFDKNMVRLSDSIGNRVVLLFYPAAFTGVCTKEMCTVSVDGIFANAAFADANEINFPLLSDTNRQATRAYGVEIPFVMPEYTAAQRSVFVIDEVGKISYAWVAENPGIEPDYEGILNHLDA